MMFRQMQPFFTSLKIASVNSSLINTDPFLFFFFFFFFFFCFLYFSGLVFTLYLPLLSLAKPGLTGPRTRLSLSPTTRSPYYASVKERTAARLLPCPPSEQEGSTAVRTCALTSAGRLIGPFVRIMGAQQWFSINNGFLFRGVSL